MATEKRLIDANALVPYLWSLFKFFGSIPCSEADKATQRGIKRCIGEIKKMPTVDAVEVVRCKDCKHYVLHALACRHENFNGFIPMNGYCYFGERKDND